MPSPMVTATLQAALLSSASNILAQFIEAYRGERAFMFNSPEFFRFVTLTLITAPPNYLWQGLLERTFPAYPRDSIYGAAPGAPIRSPRSSMSRDIEAGDGLEKRDDYVYASQPKPRISKRNTITKWFVDCITMGAIMNTVAFLVIMGIMKGQGTAEIGQNIRTETIPIIIAGYKIWPIASIISFSFIPVERRIVFLSCVGLCWGVYMSLVAARV
ncbi:uncharacterized protein K452DRAFT_301432 [Aplosporella prunicola CBS 121167]|uniref:Mpv17/PMP22 family protein n=1 Tax=Aplosporella prunicola CBS 121167 TaxID=1176127 RepID=A0A6A6B1J9_9PEZI|nr:uncharacterized protein K452DRAFT_301432 [Aplosporella prunicola CBS 121167]KAF2138059.1 hypothetical protein K452DRAFT_301432 [Aplosporella prunicola CBS 121167]